MCGTMSGMMSRKFTSPRPGNLKRTRAKEAGITSAMVTNMVATAMMALLMVGVVHSSLVKYAL